jgi:hypothetical protein
MGFKFELDLKLPNGAPPINASYPEGDRELLIAEDQNPAKLFRIAEFHTPWGGSSTGADGARAPRTVAGSMEPLPTNLQALKLDRRS